MDSETWLWKQDARISKLEAPLRPLAAMRQRFGHLDAYSELSTGDHGQHKTGVTSTVRAGHPNTRDSLGALQKAGCTLRGSTSRGGCYKAVIMIDIGSITILTNYYY